MSDISFNDPDFWPKSRERQQIDALAQIEKFVVSKIIVPHKENCFVSRNKSENGTALEWEIPFHSEWFHCDFDGNKYNPDTDDRYLKKTQMYVTVICKNPDCDAKKRILANAMLNL